MTNGLIHGEGSKSRVILILERRKPWVLHIPVRTIIIKFMDTEAEDPYPSSDTVY